MVETTNELDLGKITVVADDETLQHFVKAFRLIADHDPELFAQMRAKNWRIAPCNEVPGICENMTIQSATGWSPSTPSKKSLGTDIDTFMALGATVLDAVVSGVEFDMLLAGILAHEFVHLFLGPGERTPTQCSLQLAEKIGDKNLIEYFKHQFDRINASNEWDI